MPSQVDVGSNSLLLDVSHGAVFNINEWQTY